MMRRLSYGMGRSILFWTSAGDVGLPRRRRCPDLAGLVEPTTRGDPMAPLLWTAKSLRNLAAELHGLGHRISHNVVGDLLRHLGYSLQANRKTREGTEHPDRDAQFGYINRKVKQALAANEPAISGASMHNA